MNPTPTLTPYNPENVTWNAWPDEPPMNPTPTLTPCNPENVTWNAWPGKPPMNLNPTLTPQNPENLTWNAWPGKPPMNLENPGLGRCVKLFLGDSRHTTAKSPISSRAMSDATKCSSCNEGVQVGFQATQATQDSTSVFLGLLETFNNWYTAPAM